MLATVVSKHRFQYRITDTGFYTFLHHLPPVGGEADTIYRHSKKVKPTQQKGENNYIILYYSPKERDFYGKKIHDFCSLPFPEHRNGTGSISHFR